MTQYTKKMFVMHTTFESMPLSFREVLMKDSNYLYSVKKDY